MTERGTKYDKAKGMVGTIEAVANGTLPLLWNNWKYGRVESFL